MTGETAGRLIPAGVLQTLFPRKSVWMINTTFDFSVTAQLPGANGYTGGKVIIIDTENTLYPFQPGQISCGSWEGYLLLMLQEQQPCSISKSTPQS